MWETYKRFVIERHRVWEARQAGLPAPWTDEPLVATRKFTNAYRVLDYGSQFILTDLVTPDVTERDMLMRLFLYRHTGRVETWRFLDVMMGYPTVADLDDVLRLWQDYRAGNRPVFTGAYLVFPQSQEPGTDKLESIIRLTQRLFTPGSPDDLVPDFLAATTPRERFDTLRRNKGVADFMSMQVLTDWGYTDFGGDDENKFVVPGPGAVKGAQALRPGFTPIHTLYWAHERIERKVSLYGRPLSLMDVQNTLCEFSKYVRYLERDLTTPYVPAHPGPQPEPTLPLHWRL